MHNVREKEDEFGYSEEQKEYFLDIIKTTANLIIHNDLLQSQALLMPDRFPFYFGKQGYDIDRYVGQHEDREGECVQDFLSGAAMNLLPFTDGGNDTENEDSHA